MKNFMRFALLATFAGLIIAQDAAAPQAAPEQAAAPQPGQPSPEEVAALQALAQPPQTAADLDSQIQKVDEFVAKFPQSQFKGFAYQVAAQANQMKGNSTRAVFYYEAALKEDPKDYSSMLMIAAETAQSTREFDLDKDQKLTRANKLVTDALALIPTAPKPNPQLTDEQWENFKKDDTARAYEALGLIAMAKPDYNEAAKQFQASIDAAASLQPATYVRLGGALNEAKRTDEAIAALDKVIAMPGVPDQIKSVAESERKRSDQIKNAK